MCIILSGSTIVSLITQYTPLILTMTGCGNALLGEKKVQPDNTVNSSGSDKTLGVPPLMRPCKGFLGTFSSWEQALKFG